MRIEFDVQMTTSKMYDYMLYHTFHGMQGLLGEIVGVLLIIGFVITDPHKWLYLIFGLIVLLYLPVTLFLNAKRQVTLTPAFKEPIHYVLTEEGFEVHIGEQSDSMEWANVRKVVSTSKNLILYTSKNTATLFPRADLKDNETKVIEIISTHVNPKKVNIRV